MYELLWLRFKKNYLTKKDWYIVHVYGCILLLAFEISCSVEKKDVNFLSINEMEYNYFKDMNIVFFQ